MNNAFIQDVQFDLIDPYHSKKDTDEEIKSYEQLEDDYLYRCYEIIDEYEKCVAKLLERPYRQKDRKQVLEQGFNFMVSCRVMIGYLESVVDEIALITTKI